MNRDSGGIWIKSHLQAKAHKVSLGFLKVFPEHHPIPTRDVLILMTVYGVDIIHSIL